MLTLKIYQSVYITYYRELADKVYNNTHYLINLKHIKEQVQTLKSNLELQINYSKIEVGEILA